MDENGGRKQQKSSEKKAGPQNNASGEQNSASKRSSLLTDKKLLAKAAFNAGATYYGLRRTPKLAIPAAALSAAWTYASAALGRKLDEDANISYEQKPDQKPPASGKGKPGTPKKP